MVSAEGSSSNPWAQLAAWRRTRLPWAFFVPLACLLAGVAQSQKLDLPLLLAQAGLAWLYLASFRLADDLFDRELDQVHHPDRVLARATSLAPFLLATLGLALASWVATLVVFSAHVFATLVAGSAFFALFYLHSRELGLPRGVHAHLVLLKYPFFIHLLMAAPAKVDATSLRLLAWTYLVAAFYEMSHDAELRRGWLGRGVWVLEGLALVGIWVGFGVH